MLNQINQKSTVLGAKADTNRQNESVDLRLTCRSDTLVNQYSAVIQQQQEINPKCMP